VCPLGTFNSTLFEGVFVSELMPESEKVLCDVSSYTHPISDSIALRVYSDTSPQNQKTANLQKGLILLHDEIELAGEGIGFGVPIAQYADETFFSGSAYLQIKIQNNVTVIRKEFLMDQVCRDTFREVQLDNIGIRAIVDFISFLYQKNKQIAKFVLLAKQGLMKIGANAVFVKMPSKGKVTVTYIIGANRITVKLDMAQLDQTNLQKVFVLNEQGSQFFCKYEDSDGNILVDEQIGAWNRVTVQYAKISDAQGKIGFTLKNFEGVILRRGREFVRGYLDWIGLDYEFSPVDKFEYEIELLG